MKMTSTVLLYDGRAEEAMNFYMHVFDDAEILECTKYGPEGPGEAGSIKEARFRIGDGEFRCLDSSAAMDFTFNPAVSIRVEANSEKQVQEWYDALSEYGKVMMPLDDYGFSRQFAWVTDRFGVAWQLSLQ